MRNNVDDLPIKTFSLKTQSRTLTLMMTLRDIRLNRVTQLNVRSSLFPLVMEST